MDITRDIIYRGFLLNDSSVDSNPGAGIGDGIAGCVVDNVDYGDVDVVQFREKRSLQDGMDAGDVFLGARRIHMAGTLYGATRNLLFDALADLRQAMSPTLAQRDEPLDKGYQPLYFSVPTNRATDYPAGAIDLRFLAMPYKLVLTFDRDRIGGSDADALAIPWSATFIMKDPALLAELPQDYVSTLTTVRSCTASTADLFTDNGHGLISGDRVRMLSLTGGAGLAVGTTYYVIASGLTTNAFKVSNTLNGSAVDITSTLTAGTYMKAYSDAPTFNNRGNYHCPLNALWVVGATAGTIVGNIGGSNFTITVPASTGNRTIRYKGSDKILTVEENSLEVLRMDLLTFQNATTHPLVVGGLTYPSLTYLGVTVLAGSHVWFWEQYAC